MHYDIIKIVRGFSPGVKLVISIFLDASILIFATFLSQLLISGYIYSGALNIIYQVTIFIVVLRFLGLYNDISSETDLSISLNKLIIGSLLANLILIWNLDDGIAIFFSSTSLSCLLLIFYRGFARNRLKEINKNFKKIGVYGAGAAGAMLSSTISKSLTHKICFFIDDNKLLIGRRTSNIPIISIKDAQSYISKHGVTEIALAIPSLTKENKINIIKSIGALGVRVTRVPHLEDIVLGKKSVEAFSTFSISDLLGRESIPPHKNLLKEAISIEDVVLVTGAGGSIGGEICLQLVKLKPSKIILLDISEHALYEIERKILSNLKDCEIVTIIGNVCDLKLLESIQNRHKITIIFHAAAYKHVPMVEKNIMQTVSNNILGTFGLVQFADKFCIKKFVLISTDKAVRPTNVMGATKRFCEIILQSKNNLNIGSDKTIYSMVRFGNVLGSSGSVVPLFREQIESGGPVTLTDKEITRYFMSIPEAAELVIQSTSLASGGDVFVLDMGEPIKIFDLATLMINLSGLSIKDDKNLLGDIEIQITGLRPGEKLYEELLIGNNVKPTVHEKIMRAEEVFIDWDQVEIIIEKLTSALKTNNEKYVLELLIENINGFNHMNND